MRDFRIVVAAHGGLAAALVRSAELICGELRDVTPVGIAPSQTPETFATALRRAIEMDERPVLVLTDLDGGTPGTIVVAGATLGMLVEAATGLDGLDAAAAGHLVEAGRDGIVDVTARLARRGAA